jgi:hypothetical protein
VGLDIATLIIDKHGWALHIDSEINVGTRMRVTMT